MTILGAIALGLVGLILGVGLAVAYSKLSVEVDERVTAIMGVLPGANCGGCGFPGCAGFAEDLVLGGASLTGCPACGENAVKEIARILGCEAGEITPVTARVLCNSRTEPRFVYDGVEDCRSAALLAGGPTECRFACLGFGTCATVCPFDAIAPGPEGAPPRIDPDRCVGCGLCVQMCPRKVIALQPKAAKVCVECSSMDPAKEARRVCKIGCVGCKLCERNCPTGAIAVVDNIARIDYHKCVDCGICVAKCPRGIIALDAGLPPRFAEINQKKCTGCGQCLPSCPSKAIVRKDDESKPAVYPLKCTGCGACIEACPEEGALGMKEYKAPGAES